MVFLADLVQACIHWEWAFWIRLMRDEEMTVKLLGGYRSGTDYVCVCVCV